MFKNCRDRPDIHAYEDQIHYRYEAWSPKMTRRSYTGILSAELSVVHAERVGPPETAQRMRRALAEREWDAFAPWMCTLIFGPALAHQRRRDESQDKDLECGCRMAVGHAGRRCLRYLSESV